MPSAPSAVKHKPALKLESSVLAVAIVNSAPLYRRQVFLQPSQSFDHSSSDCTRDSVLKRQSWHVERVTARILSVLEETGVPFNNLPTFGRSLSNDISLGKR